MCRPWCLRSASSCTSFWPRFRSAPSLKYQLCGPSKGESPSLHICEDSNASQASKILLFLSSPTSNPQEFLSTTAKKKKKENVQQVFTLSSQVAKDHIFCRLSRLSTQRVSVGCCCWEPEGSLPDKLRSWIRNQKVTERRSAAGWVPLSVQTIGHMLWLDSFLTKEGCYMMGFSLKMRRIDAENQARKESQLWRRVCVFKSGRVNFLCRFWPELLIAMYHGAHVPHW